MVINTTLTEEEIDLFFTDPDQMGLTEEILQLLKQEGISKPSDLLDFDEDTMKQVTENIRKTPIAGSKPVKHYQISAKSQKRLMEAADLVRFYDTIGRKLTSEGLTYATVIKDFAEQWKALKARRDEKEAEVPKISRALPVIKWTEAFDDYLHRTVGVRYIPLSYVTRAKVEIPVEIQERAEGKAHSIGGSIVDDLIERSSHAHALYKEDNAKVYYLLEEATRSTQYAPSLKPFQRSKDGRMALISIRSQYAGKDKWEAEIKRMNDILHNRKWKAQANYPLEKFVALHRNAFVTMQQCAQHVTWQLPLERTRVTYFLDAIQTEDSQLQANIAQIKADESGPKSRRNNFEAMAAFILPADPVARKKQGNTSHDEASVSDVTGEISSSFGTKQGIGKTGVHLRFYKRKEYKLLTPEQKKELSEWRAKTKGGGQDRANTNNKTSGSTSKKVTFSKKNQVHSIPGKKMAAAVSREVTKQLKRGAEEDDLDSLIMSLQTGKSNSTSGQEQPNKKTRFNASPVTQVNTAALRSIIRKVKNTQNMDDNTSED